MRKYLAVLLFSFVGTVALFVANAQESSVTTPVHNEYQVIFDYGQISGIFYQPAESVFTGTISMQTNYSYSQPQQTIIHLGYDSTRVDISSIKCLTEWGCHVSQIENDKYLDSHHHPHVNVCMNIPVGIFPVTQLFSVTFKTKATLGETSNWWNSSFGEAPGSCETNPTGTGFRKNLRAGGSGVCGGVFEPCNRGPSPGNLNYEGFGSAGQAGTQAQSNGQSNTVSNGQGGGSTSEKIANQVAENPAPRIDTSNQGQVPEETSIKPNPFYDGKEYASSTIADKANSAIRNPAKNVTLFVVFGIFICLTLAAGYMLYKKIRK